MTKLAAAAKITTDTATKKFVFGSGRNLKKTRVQATQPEVSIPLLDARVIVTPKTSKAGNDYLEVKAHGKNAITLMPESYEIEMSQKAGTYAFAMLYDPYRVFMKDENGQPVGTGFLHGKGFHASTEEEVNNACLQWQEDQENGNTREGQVLDLLK